MGDNSKSSEGGGAEEIPFSGLSVVCVNKWAKDEAPADGESVADGVQISDNKKKGFTGDSIQKATIEWDGIDVFVPIGQGNLCQRLCRKGVESNEPRTKQILFNGRGKVEPGTLLALMGASGAGKSTLLNVLAHRNVGHIQVKGSVKVNNKPMGAGITSISAYVQQEDLFIGTLTVREHLKFQALLRMDAEISIEQRMAVVEEVIIELGLSKCADTIIGTPGRVRGISGGEKKRLSFASEILRDPSILFADEPTSGLDSFMAQSVIATLEKLAAQGRTIICTVHQPSSEVYNMFTNLLLLAEGRTAYFGSVEEAIPHFTRIGYPCPPNYNPADYFVHTLAVIPEEREKCKMRIKEICDAYEDEANANNNDDSIDKLNTFDDLSLDHSRYRSSWFRQFRTVLWRSWLTNKRESMLLRLRIIMATFIGVLCGLIYLQMDLDTDGVQNISGAMFFLLVSTGFTNLQAVSFTFPSEMPVFLREHKNGMYRTDVYFLSKTLAEVPVFVISPIIVSAIAYWMIGLRADFVRFVIFCVIMILVTNTAVSLGYVASTLTKSVEAASALGPPLMIPFLLFGGFFLKNRSVPDYFIWVEYLSLFKYSFELMGINQWEDYGPIGSCRVNAINNTSGRDNFCFRDGKAVLDFLGFEKDNYDTYFIVLAALLVGFRLVAYLLLLRITSKKE